jgi:ribulose-phosphate 3-epimerase
VDGGIKVDTAGIVAGAGADILVSGSGIFPDHIAANVKKLREVAERARASRA